MNGNPDKPGSSAPYRVTGLEQIERLMQGGEVSIDQLEEFVKLKRRISALVNGTLQVEKQEVMLSFHEANKLLHECGFDLVKARDNAVKHHKAWGLIELAKQKGIALDEHSYSELFEKYTFTEEGVKKLQAALKKGEDWMPVFNPGGIGFVEMAEKLIWSERKKLKIGGGEVIGMNGVKEFGLKDLQPFIDGEANACSGDKATDQYNKIYDEKVAQKHGPQILFTRNCFKTESGIPGRLCLEQALRNGVHFIDPASDIIRWRTQMDQRKPWFAHRYPDFNSSTIYPLFLAVNGRFLALKICIDKDYENPLRLRFHFLQWHDDCTGPRVVLC